MFHLDKGKSLTSSPSYKSVHSDRDENINKWSKNVSAGIITPSSSSSDDLSKSSSGSPLTNANGSPAYPVLSPGTPYLSAGHHGLATSSEITLADPETAHPAMGNSTVRLVEDHPHVMFRQPDGSIVGHGDDRSFSRSTVHSQHQQGSFVEIPLGSRASHAPTAQSSASLHGSEMTLHEPQMSAFLTVMSLIFVTIVRTAAVSLICLELTWSQAVAFTADWLVEAMDEISSTVSKQWIGLILLPAVSSIAGLCWSLA